MLQKPPFVSSLQDWLLEASHAIGLYRDVWIAAIASSRTRLANLMGVMYLRHNANYVRYA